jgi:hypothetical protein
MLPLANNLGTNFGVAFTTPWRIETAYRFRTETRLYRTAYLMVLGGEMAFASVGQADADRVEMGRFLN